MRIERGDVPVSLRRSATASVLLLLSMLHGSGAAAQDFATRAAGWSSISELVRLAEERANAAVVDEAERLDLGTLRAVDSLLLVHPRQDLPARELTLFLRGGGRVALADDYGQGGSLLTAFQIGRGEPTVDRALQLRGNPALLVARPKAQHRLAQGVRALVTNHPTIVYHRALSPVFELAEGEAVVLAGAVESGRLVVLSDPSVLIDNMLELRGNRAFAENLIDYLDEGRGGTLYVVGPEGRLVGRWGEPGADRPLHDLRAWLESTSSMQFPPLALRIGTLALLAIAATLALGALPRRSPYRTERMFARPRAHGGFVGRVRYFAERSADLLPPVLVYKHELEEEILRKLSLSGQTVLRDVLAAMRARGIGDEDVNAMRALLLELDGLHKLSDRPPGRPRVTPMRFRALVATGDRLLVCLGDAEAETPA